MEVILIKAAQLILSLSLLVIIHEFGHFLFARLFKTRVEKFYLFFDPWFSLFKVKKGDTEYGVGWLPLGGYVKISGMIDESMDKEAMKLPPQPHEFRSKKTWQRLLIMLGGVLMNFILAFLIYICILWAWGEQYLPTANVKYGIEVDSVGMKIGFENGDKIVTVDGEPVEDFHKIVSTIVLDKARLVQVERDGKMTDVEISDEDLSLMIKSKGVFSFRMPFDYRVAKFAKDSPAKAAGLEVGDRIVGMDSLKYDFNDQFRAALKQNIGKQVSLHVLRGQQEMVFPMMIPETGLLGIQLDQDLAKVFEFKTVNYGFIESIPAGISRGFTTINDYLKQFRLLFSPKTKAYEHLGGFISIGNIFPGAWNWLSFWSMTALLSIILGVMNLLPIPALDGGHVMFLFYEIVTGRKPGDKFLEYAQITGMVILFSLLIYANGNDFVRYFADFMKLFK